MRGSIDADGRALLRVGIAAERATQPVAIDAWIDTGFTGDLVLPQPIIDRLAPRQSGTVDAILADGSQIEVKTFTCFVNWFGEERRLEVVANDGDYPLLGVGLLLGLELRANYHTMALSLTSPSPSAPGAGPRAVTVASRPSLAAGRPLAGATCSQGSFGSSGVLPFSSVTG